MLLVTQGLDRIGFGGSDGLPAYGCQCNGEGDQGGLNEDDGADGDPVSEALQPLVHRPPADGDSKGRGQEYEFDEILGEEQYDT